MHDADFFARGVQYLDRFADCFRSGPHQDDHSGGVLRTLVFEQLIVAAGKFLEALHEGFDNAGDCLVIGVAGFPRLKIGIGVMRGAANEGVFGI